jgi:hypothetical protein
VIDGGVTNAHNGYTAIAALLEYQEYNPNTISNQS